MLIFESNSIKVNRVLVDNFIESDNNNHSTCDYSFIVSYGDFVSEHYDVVNKNAAIIELKEDIDKTISKFDGSVRNHIRRFDKLPELSFHNEINDKKAFYEFYSLAEKCREWYPVPQDELFASIVFYVCYNDKPISGMTAYTHNNFMRIGRIFSTRNISSLDNRNLIFGVAAKKLIFEFCQYAIKNGFHQLDLGGVDLKSEQKSGITEFKLSFTDKVVPVKIGRWSKIDYKVLQQDFLNKGLDLT